jgi:hypothetical protein
LQQRISHRSTVAVVDEPEILDIQDKHRRFVFLLEYPFESGHESVLVRHPGQSIDFQALAQEEHVIHEQDE